MDASIALRRQNMSALSSLVVFPGIAIIFSQRYFAVLKRKLGDMYALRHLDTRFMVGLHISSLRYLNDGTHNP